MRATAVLAGFRTDSPVNIDLSVPIWTIEHVAAAFHLSVDAAREYTYRKDFPRPRAGFSRNLWTRQEVLDWFTGLAPKVWARRCPSVGAGPAGSASTGSTSTTRTPPSLAQVIALRGEFAAARPAWVRWPWSWAAGRGRAGARRFS